MTRKKASTPAPLSIDEKYNLYENSVQTPDLHVKWFDEVFKEHFGRQAHSLKEDFCGTHWQSVEWVKMHSKNTALGLDLDPEPIEYGKRTRDVHLTAEQRKRLKIVQKNVLEPTRPGVDIQAASNFSFNIFHTRKELKEYFQAAYDSLGKEGIFILEMAGGTGMMDTMKEKTKITDAQENPWFTYIWKQKDYNYIKNTALYTISFKMKDGTKYKDVFVYDWRLWTIPEVREVLEEVGFKSTHAYLEDFDDDGDGDGEYIETEKSDECYTWVGFVVGVKR